MTAKSPLRPVEVWVEWGCELHSCPMSQKTWQRICKGKPVVRLEAYWYEGKRFLGRWEFNVGRRRALLITYDYDGVVFDGDLEAATVTIDGTAIKVAPI
jgi:hypothetical protein